MTGEFGGYPWPSFRLAGRFLGGCVLLLTVGMPDGAEVEHTTRIASQVNVSRLLEQWVLREDREGTPGAIRASRVRQVHLRNSMFPCEGSMLGRQRQL